MRPLPLGSHRFRTPPPPLLRRCGAARSKARSLLWLSCVIPPSSRTRHDQGCFFHASCASGLHSMTDVTPSSVSRGAGGPMRLPFFGPQDARPTTPRVSRLQYTHCCAFSRTTTSPSCEIRSPAKTPRRVWSVVTTTNGMVLSFSLQGEIDCNLDGSLERIALCDVRKRAVEILDRIAHGRACRGHTRAVLPSDALRSFLARGEQARVALPSRERLRLRHMRRNRRRLRLIEQGERGVGLLQLLAQRLRLLAVGLPLVVLLLRIRRRRLAGLLRRPLPLGLAGIAAPVSVVVLWANSNDSSECVAAQVRERAPHCLRVLLQNRRGATASDPLSRAVNQLRVEHAHAVLEARHLNDG